MGAELHNVRSFFSAGSVLLTIVLEETDPAQAALFQSALAAKSGELATSVGQGVSEVPGISAVSTGPITGAVAVRPVATASGVAPAPGVVPAPSDAGAGVQPVAGAGVQPVAGAGVQAVPVPSASMPDNVQVAVAMAAAQNVV